MPFASYAEETWMKHNKPELYKQWVEKYGHYSGTQLRVTPKVKETLKSGYKRKP
jgi:hypothetical protein